MIRGNSTLLALTLAALATPVAVAQEPRYFVENGIQYRETTQVMQRPITETKYQPHETSGVAPRYTTDMQESVRTYQVPVVEQQWVPGLQRTWNVFAPPVLSYRLMPVTRWETRTETVRLPVTKVEYVPTKSVVQVPITNTHIAEERIVRREAIGPAGSGGGTAVARTEPVQSFGGSSAETAAVPSDPYGTPATRQGKLQ
jgi:hypothetical protein